MDEQPKPEVIHPTIWGLNFPDGSEGRSEEYEPAPTPPPPPIFHDSISFWGKIKLKYRTWRHARRK